MIAAARKDRAASLTHWLVSLAMKRADELGIPEEVEQLPAKKPAKKKPPK